MQASVKKLSVMALLGLFSSCQDMVEQTAPRNGKTFTFYKNNEAGVFNDDDIGSREHVRFAAKGADPLVYMLYPYVDVPYSYQDNFIGLHLRRGQRTYQAVNQGSHVAITREDHTAIGTVAAIREGDTDSTRYDCDTLKVVNADQSRPFELRGDSKPGAKTNGEFLALTKITSVTRDGDKRLTRVLHIRP